MAKFGCFSRAYYNNVKKPKPGIRFYTNKNPGFENRNRVLDTLNRRSEKRALKTKNFEKVGKVSFQPKNPPRRVFHLKEFLIENNKIGQI